MTVPVPVFVVVADDEVALTAPRRQAALVAGMMTTQYPDGVQQADPDDTRENFYFYKPDDWAPAGVFDFGIVRQDVVQDIPAQHSDFEFSVDTAAARAAGRVVFEREVSARGVGQWEHGADYRVGSRAVARMWGRDVPTFVSRVEPDGVGGVGVGLGGKLISDRDELRVREARIRADLAREAAQRERDKQRLEAQAERDRQQTQQIKQTQSSLAYQQSTLSAQQSTLSQQQSALSDQQDKLATHALQMNEIGDYILNLANACYYLADVVHRGATANGWPGQVVTDIEWARNALGTIALQLWWPTFIGEE